MAQKKSLTHYHQSSASHTLSTINQRQKMISPLFTLFKKEVTLRDHIFLNNGFLFVTSESNTDSRFV